MEPAPRIRAFIAVRLGAETDRAISGLIEELRESGDGISWARSANLHLTLRFLGAAIDSRLIAPLSDALAAIAAQTAPFTVEARGQGAFPNLAHPRVIWVGLEGEALPALARCVEQAAVASGFTPERRPYSPHLTIGRVRDLRRWTILRGKLEVAASRDFGSSPIAAMILYESQLASSGAIYRELAQFQFRAKPAA
jgi:RNA 2',3'-cyclic 3'-phosphodiesterase